MKSRAAFAAMLPLAAALWLAPARAEVWGYVDERGVAHFATERIDERYELFFRGGESYDTADGVRTPRSVAVPSASSSRLIAYFEISPSFKQVKHHLRDAARETGVEMELLQALIATESGFDPTAVSPKGAVGLMQIMPATAQRYGVRGDTRAPVSEKLFDPRTNVRTGTRYLRDLIRMFPGRLELALAAYNAGEGAVRRAGNRIPNYRETQNYVKTVMQLYTMLKPPATVAGTARPHHRVQVELPAPAVPLAPAATPGRSNMPTGTGLPADAPLAARDSLPDGVSPPQD